LIVPNAAGSDTKNHGRIWEKTLSNLASWFLYSEGKKMSTVPRRLETFQEEKQKQRTDDMEVGNFDFEEMEK
jgi:hypothetical protein